MSYRSGQEEHAVGLWDRLNKGGVAEQAVDTGPTIGEAVADATAETREIWARPGLCPKCGGRGYLDRIDVIDRIQYEHCTDCFHRWSVAEADTVPAP